MKKLNGQIITVVTEDGTTITGKASEVEMILKIRDYNESPKGSPKWQEDMQKMYKELREVEQVLRSPTGERTCLK